jgi:Undecaprenyl-phosphate galactose phosphotransferase WbaP
MASITVVSTQSAFPLIRLPKIRRSPFLCSGVFVLCDAVALMAAAAVVLLGRRSMDGSIDLRRYFELWPAVGVLFAIFACSNLYPGIIHNAVTELRRLALALTVGFLAMTGMISAKTSANHSRQILFLWWIAAIIMTPLLRSAVRGLVSRRSWWGIPVAVFDTGPESAAIIQELESHPEIGLRPVAFLSGSHTTRPRHGLPVVDPRFAASIRACGVERALIALPDSGCSKVLEELEDFESIFPRLMILHGAASLYSLTADARQIGSSLAFDVTRNLLLPLPRLAKRTMDLVVVSLASPTVVLIILLLGILVRLESPGPVFYGHRRIGRDRSNFLTWKIRTMQLNADELLQQALANDEALREEWSRDRKLRRDPRITRVGRFLRQTSLDELPQFWNVLRGEMSLVGPRPIVEDEIASYGQNFALYCRVTPGLTGLWQVSGRSTVSSSTRVRLDSYYVRNWSPWLDLHILLRTAKVVLTGQGAY